MLDLNARANRDPDLDVFRESVRTCFARHLIPHLDRWEMEGNVDRQLWNILGDAGLLCPTVPIHYGGPGLDFRYNAVVAEELFYAGSTFGLGVHSDIVADYIVRYGSEEQKQHWLPRMMQGTAVTAIAMTEPAAGSDLQGIKTSAHVDAGCYILNGSKTYITNGQHADLVLVVAKTDRGAGAKGITLILVEADRPGFTRGRNLDKIGQNSSDTSELFFSDVRVPVTNRLGEEGKGFGYLMAQLPQERLAIAITAAAHAQRAFELALEFTKSRKAFGKLVFDFQNTRFVLADLASKLQVGWAHLDWALQRHVQGKLTAVEASAAKLWHTELLWEVVDAALQLHGGAGYMNEYLIARLWRDARVMKLYGGTSEIMKEVIGRSL